MRHVVMSRGAFGEAVQHGIDRYRKLAVKTGTAADIIESRVERLESFADETAEAVALDFIARVPQDGGGFQTYYCPAVELFGSMDAVPGFAGGYDNWLMSIIKAELPNLHSRSGSVLSGSLIIHVSDEPGAPVIRVEP
jgi:hypothetical protein